jgi:hypothetical protein
MNPNSNVTPIESKKPAIAASHTISFVLDGFPVSTCVEGGADVLRAVVDKLKAIGAQPPLKFQDGTLKAAGVSVCPVHNTQMKVSSAKPGSYFCPKKNEDGSYCKSKA